MEISHHELGRDPLYKIWNRSSKNFMIFTYSEGGSFVFQDKVFAMQKGSLCFIKKGTYHYTVPKMPEKYDRSKIYLSDEHFDKLLALLSCDERAREIFSGDMAYAIVPKTEIEEIEELFNRANKSVKSDKTEFLSCYFSLMSAIKKYGTTKHESVKAHALKDCVSVAIDFINKNYAETLTLEQICKNVLTSKYHFCRKFKSAVGMTVMDYLTYTRVVVAKKLLAETNLTIIEISEKCGFSGISYFCQKFKSLTGKTANQYRKQFNR